LSSQNERNRKTRLLALLLITLLLASVGFIAVYYQQAQVAESQLSQAIGQSLMLNSTVQQVIETAPTASFNLTYKPMLPTMDVSNNMVTFLFGYVEATNLSELYYPSTLLFSFNVSYLRTGTAKVKYSYTTTQSVQLVKGITIVDSPFGIYPLQIMNATLGETIIFYISVTAVVYWNPVHVMIAKQNALGTAQVNVVS
jgi:hypothetical protein